MKYDLKNKTVIITGASSGIGRKIASLLVSEYGCTVYAVARRAELLAELKNELGERLIPKPFDASVRENWLTLAAELESEGTLIDTLISCAGVLPVFSSVENARIEDLKNAMDINFYAQVYATEAMLPIIKKSTQGAIISFSSSSALCPFAGVSAYCATKSASRMYFECLASEMKQIYVATVMNGFVKTDIMKNQSATDADTRKFMRVCADLDKTVKKIMRKIRRRRVRIIVGKDAHLMNFMYRHFPIRGPKIISWFLKKMKLDMFSKI